MKMACQNTDQVFAIIRDAIRPGMRECNLVPLGLKHLYELGCDHTEDIVCCSGSNTNPFDPSSTDKPI
jgi:Xaa-Pro aminopeptidase